MKIGLVESTHTQQGVALLTILLLVVAIVIVAGSMLARQKIMIREYQVTQRQGQLNEAALAAEAFARELLVQDSIANQTDSLQDLWAKPINDFVTDTGKVSLHITDDASCFNINNLYHDGKADAVAISYFTALLQSQGLDPAIAHAVLDWQDIDSDTTPEGGAEADYYQSLPQKPPVAIPNQPLTSVDELVYIKGMDKEKLAKIKPLLTAVPYFVPMNVNTVTPELLAILPLIQTQPSPANPSATVQQNSQSASSPVSTATPSAVPLDIPAVTSWASTRATAMPLNSVQQLWQQPIFASVSDSQRQWVAPLFDVQSRAFRVTASITQDDRQRYFTSQLAKIATPNTANLNNPSSNLANSVASEQVISFNRQFLSTPYPVASEAKF